MSSKKLKNFTYLNYFLTNLLFFSRMHAKKNKLSGQYRYSDYANMWNVHHITVGRWFKGEIPGPKNLKMIVQYFSNEFGIDISVDEFLHSDLSKKFSRADLVSENKMIYSDFSKQFGKLNLEDQFLIIKLIERLLKK